MNLDIEQQYQSGDVAHFIRIEGSQVKLHNNNDGIKQLLNVISHFS